MDVKSGQNSTPKKSSIVEWLKRVPLFWKYLVMMGAVLTISLVALIIVNQRYIDTLSNELLTEMQTNLKNDCEKLDNRLYSVITIPSMIEDTRYFRYLAGQRESELELKYYPVLSLLRTVLQKQLYITSDAEETLLYFRKFNSIVSTSYYEAVAENYFKKELVFSEISPEEIMQALKSHTSQVLIPMQLVQADTQIECFGIIVQPIESSIAIINLYSKRFLMESLNIQDLPEDGFFELVGPDGALLASFGDSGSLKNGNVLTGELKSYQITVRVGIPDSYFQSLLEGPKRAGIIVLVLVALLGTLLVLFFSRLSVRPIRRLILTHGTSEKAVNTNELMSLDKLISASKENESRLGLRLIKQVLAKVFYGGILSEEEESQLKTATPFLDRSFQIAVFHGSPRTNEVLEEELKSLFPNALWTMLSPEETGFLFGADNTNRIALTQLIHQMNLQGEGTIRCGVSSEGSSVADLYLAVRQAKRALPAESGIAVYQETSGNTDPVFWLWHERMYQCVLGEDEEGALQLLDQMAKEASGRNSDELFYVIRFVLENAARERGVHIPETQHYEYYSNLSVEGNIRNLGLLVRWVFDALKQQKEVEKGNHQKRILEQIRSSLADSELNAASVAADMGMSEKKIVDTVRTLTGKSFKEYLTDLRMKRASELLYSTNREIVEIASSCGFSNSSTFYRQFQNYFGIAPGLFRRSGGASAEKPADRE